MKHDRGGYRSLGQERGPGGDTRVPRVFSCKLGGRRASPPNLQEKRPGKEVREGSGERGM